MYHLRVTLLFRNLSFFALLQVHQWNQFLYKMSKEAKNNETLSKKLKTIPFSTTVYLKTIKIGDKSASVVGYVEQVFSESTFLNKVKNEDFKIFKFLLNNNDGIKVQCNVYDKNIDQFISQIKLHEKILLETVTVSKAKGYTKGNLNYELNLQHYSSITVLGEINVLKILKPKEIKFEEIPMKKGMIKIKGYLRNVFIKRNKNNEEEYFGAITDGKYKLEVLVIKDPENENCISIERGIKLELAGDLQECGKSYILIVKDDKQIKILSDEKLELENLILGSEIFLNENETTENNEKAEERNVET